MLNYDMPYRECPRFDKCNVNNCPLHQSYPNLVVDYEDKEPKCTIEKGVRVRIGSQYPAVLKYQGLTVREWTAKQRYDGLSPAEKMQLATMGKKALKKVVCSSLQEQHSKVGIDVWQS